MVKWHKVISTVVAVVFAMSGNLVMTVATAAPVATVKLSSLQWIGNTFLDKFSEE